MIARSQERLEADNHELHKAWRGCMDRYDKLEALNAQLLVALEALLETRCAEPEARAAIAKAESQQLKCRECGAPIDAEHGSLCESCSFASDV